jgi:hypothetical protein
MVFVFAGIQLTITPVTPDTHAQMVERELADRRLNQIIEEGRHRALRDSMWYGTGKIY